MSVSDINVVVLVGHLTRDMELKTIPSGTALGNIGLAVNRSVKRGDKWESDVSFIDVTIWGKTAEALAQYLKKGTRVGIQGELIQERWEKDGKSQSRIKVNAEKIELLGGSGSGKQDKGTTQPAVSTDITDDDVPF